jgi:hypothetical protein
LSIPSIFTKTPVSSNKNSLDNFLISEEEIPGDTSTPTVAPQKFNAINSGA